MSESYENENESDIDWEETDSIASYVSEDIDETVKKNQLLGQKLKTICTREFREYAINQFRLP